MEKVLVICEPRFDLKTGCTINLAMNEILVEYSKFFKEVHCLCPSKDLVNGYCGKNGIIYHTSTKYIGSKIKKAIFQFFKPDVNIIELVENYNIDLVQFRIPSTFSMSFYEILKNYNVKKTCYIAGDVYENYINNFHNFPFIEAIARFMQRSQNGMIKNTVAVSAGHVLKNKYSYLNNNIHAFYSTTHNSVLRENLGFQRDRLSVVYLGRVDDAKRLEDLVIAIKKVKDHIVHLKINIIGDGPALESIKALVSLNNLDSLFSFHGYLRDRQAINKIMLSSNVLVLPSVTEGTAKVLPEAMSCGVVPIAVENVGSNNFIIKNNENGFLVKIKDPDSIKEALLKLYNNEVLYNSILSNVYNYAEEHTAGLEISTMWHFIFKNIE